MYTYLLIMVSALFLSACSTTPKGFIVGDQAPENLRKKVPVATNSKECRLNRGNWIELTAPSAATVFPAGGYCQFKTRDGGRSCQSSQDCQGYCELSFDDIQGKSQPRCSTLLPPRWDRCVPGYFEHGKVLGRGECFGDDAEVQ